MSRDRALDGLQIGVVLAVTGGWLFAVYEGRNSLLVIAPMMAVLTFVLRLARPNSPLRDGAENKEAETP